MEKKDFYYDLRSKQRELELNYMISAILKSRLGLKFDESSSDEEDVNIYLANVLLSFAQGGTGGLFSKYISSSDVDVFNMADETDENYLKHMIYKVNADNLLISLGVFKNTAALSREDIYVGRAKAYYDISAEYDMKLYRHLTSVGIVLHKLSRLFEKYLEILGAMRKDYFNFITHVSGETLIQLKQEIDALEKDLEIGKSQDEFLDIYSEWLKQHKKAS